MEGWSPIARFYDPLMAGSIDGTDETPHDHAVIRAMNSKYKPNKAVKGDPNCTIFVGRLDPSTTEETLEDIFSDYGDISSLRLVRDAVTGASKCYAFIEYKEEYCAGRAIRHTDDMRIDGKEVFVDHELERTLSGWIPRRLGGGFGGKKESGQLRFGGKDRPFLKPILVKVNPRRSGSVKRLQEKDSTKVSSRKDDVYSDDFKDGSNNDDPAEHKDGEKYRDLERTKEKYKKRHRDHSREREHKRHKHKKHRHRHDRETKD